MGNISYKFDSEKNILISTITNTLVIDDIINHYSFIYNNNSLPRDLKVIIYGKEVLFNVKGTEIKSVSSEVQIAISKYNSIKEAIVLKHSYSTAIGMIFKEANEFPNYQFKVFSSNSMAKKWLSQ